MEQEHEVTNDFRDTEDANHVYKVGDPYPREGDYKPTKKRIEELSKTHPKYKVAFIKKVAEKGKKKKDKE
ncbi:hypothetical protein A8F94_17495 [Bacillus sp. FJAT-27225]|uniref:hypothetical protein n=1 Tax=Bacillus sp. FJAT-27225 TaxID=1743144 RepID=UPI00080C2761|nr:hypothetical protein [Bacillus sp. FJAT-27225]OCA84489.1 hypothetical protein A8F94_17495 [Bacillus sp. FJAT-27225]